MEQIVILAGSEKDKWFTDKLEEACKENGLEVKSYYKSAHKDPRGVLDNVESYSDKKIVFMSGIGWKDDYNNGKHCFPSKWKYKSFVVRKMD